MNFFESVYSLTMKIPVGKVVSYGDIANAMGKPKAARQVGWALHANPYFGIVPCHRVVNRQGKVCSGFAFGGGQKQAEMLLEEGVIVEDGTINLAVFRHTFSQEEIKEALFKESLQSL